MSIETAYLLAPEITLLAAATIIYVAGAFFPRAGSFWSWLAIASMAGGGYALYWQTTPDAFDGPLAADAFSVYVRALALGLGPLFVLAACHGACQGQAAETVGSLLLVIAGVMLVAVGGDLVFIFLGLELISIPTYVLLYIGRRGEASQEATVKYFFLSVLSSAILLYGFSFLYGLGGSTSLAEINAKLSDGVTISGARPLALVALVLVFAGLSFKVGAVPFHFYAPDVYQGTTHVNAALLSVAPKIAGLVALSRILSLSLPGMESFGWRLAMILAMATMTLGNLLALWQDNLRRLLAYSSIAHGGYLLMGLTVAFAAGARDGQIVGVDGVAAILFYLAVYAAATVGAFAVLNHLGGPSKECEKVDQLAGLGRSQPLLAVLMTLFLFSLAGIPPLAGFWGKLTLFRSTLGVDAATQLPEPLKVWFLGLAVVGVLNAAVAAAYYLRIIGAMYFKPATSELPLDSGHGSRWAAMICGAAVLLIGLFPGPLVRFSHRAAANAVLKAPAKPQAAETAVVAK